MIFCVTRTGTISDLSYYSGNRRFLRDGHRSTLATWPCLVMYAGHVQCLIPVYINWILFLCLVEHSYEYSYNTIICALYDCSALVEMKISQHTLFVANSIRDLHIKRQIYFMMLMMVVILSFPRTG